MNKTKLTAAHGHQEYNPHSGKECSLWIKNDCHAWLVGSEREKQATAYHQGDSTEQILITLSVI